MSIDDTINKQLLSLVKDCLDTLESEKLITVDQREDLGQLFLDALKHSFIVVPKDLYILAPGVAGLLYALPKVFGGAPTLVDFLLWGHNVDRPSEATPTVKVEEVPKLNNNIRLVDVDGTDYPREGG